MGIFSTSSNYQTTGKEVSVVKNNTNILILTATDTQAKTKEALAELNSKCSKGITNITTTVSVKSIAIVGFEKLEVTANCK